MISLPTSVGLGPSVSIATLPRTSQVGSTFVNTVGTISGYGLMSITSGVSEELRWVNMRIMPNEDCRRLYGSGVVVDHVFCALGESRPENQGHCQGDSGGPMIIKEGSSSVLLGVISFAAKERCGEGLPSGYMRTTHFLQWISSNTGIPIRP